MHLDNSSEGFDASGHNMSYCTCSMLVVCPPGVGRQALHPSSPPTTSAFAEASWEEEGPHTRCVLHHCHRVLRRRKDWHLSLPPHNVGEFLGGGAVATQMGRSGDTMICEKATFCTRVQVSAAWDALRHHAVGVQVVRSQDRAGLPTVGTLR